MKSSNVALAIIIGLGMVGGIAFMSQWIHNKPESQKGKTASGDTQAILVFPVIEAKIQSIVERGAKGSYDFYFKNTDPEPMTVALEGTSCKCTRVDLLLFQSEEEEKSYWQWIEAHSVSPVMVPSLGLLNLLLPAGAAASGNNLPFLSTPSRWMALLKEDQERQPAQVPGGAHGLVRLSWEAKKVGEDNLKAILQTEAEGKSPGSATLVLGINVLAPVVVHPQQATLLDLNPYSEQQVEFVCWSATRGSFRLQAKEEEGNPCFTCTCIPLEGEERRNMEKVLSQKTPMNLLAGYRVVVHVKERLDDSHQLDLGPFARNIVFKTDQEDVELRPVSVAGMVRGDVRVTYPRGDRITLPPFPKSRGITIQCKLETDKGINQIKVDKIPDFVSLEEPKVIDEGRDAELKEWGMTFRVKPDSIMLGPFPDKERQVYPDCAIYLNIYRQKDILKPEDKPFRRIRIPMSGVATFP